MAFTRELLSRSFCPVSVNSGKRPAEALRRGPSHGMLSCKIPRLSPSAASDQHEGIVRVIEREYRERVKDFWQGRAEVYDVNNTFHPPLCTHLVRVAELHKGSNVLDIATGTGYVAFAAADAVGPTGHVLGIDITESMLQQVRQEHTKRPSSALFCKFTDCLNQGISFPFTWRSFALYGRCFQLDIS